jgi:hypothetical protein
LDERSQRVVDQRLIVPSAGGVDRILEDHARSAKSTPCLRRLERAFSGSHWKVTSQVYVQSCIHASTRRGLFPPAN